MNKIRKLGDETKQSGNLFIYFPRTSLIEQISQVLFIVEKFDEETAR